MVHFVDWFPTLMAAAGLDFSPVLPLDGQNVLPFYVEIVIIWKHAVSGNELLFTDFNKQCCNA